MSGMKIGFVALGFPPDVGGTELYNVEYAKRLHAAGHDLRVVTWESDSEGQAEADAALPFEVRRLPMARRRKVIVPAGVPEALREWGSEVAFVSRASRMMPDVVAAVARRVPTVVSVHELREKHRGRNLFNRWRIRRRYGLDRAAAVTVNSEDTRARMVALGVPEDRLAVVYPGCDVESFQPDEAAGAALRAELGIGDRPMLLTVSRLASNKGHLQVLEVLPKVLERCPELIYVVVGRGPMQEPIEARARELGIADRVRLTGLVPSTRPYYQACDVFVMVSTPQNERANAGEGFGIAYVEAGACGKPVVASDSGGGAEIVRDGETGRVVTPRDPAALADALVELLGDRVRAAALGAAGRERVQRYDWGQGLIVLEETLRRAAA